MTTDLPVEHEEADSRGRYVIYLPDGTEAEMTYGWRDAKTMVADHTGVPRYYRGHGIAERIVATAMADAREKGFKIVPLCSFVVAQFRRHPEWSDLMAQRSAT